MIRARLATGQGDPEIGTERIAVYHEDGRVEELALHDYARVYALAGVYEQIVQEALGCRSPQTTAELLAGVLDQLGHDRATAGVLDLAAGNGVSGEALREVGIGGPLIGVDVVPEARDAAQRDRPGLYAEYLVPERGELPAAEAARLRELGLTALTCVQPVGDRSGQVPTAALAAAATALADDAPALVLYDPRRPPDVIDETFWQRALGDGGRAERVAHDRYLHRFLVTGSPYELEASVWRLRR